LASSDPSDLRGSAAPAGPSAVTVRPAVADDAAALHALLVAHNDARAGIAHIRSHLARAPRDELAFVAEIAGEVVAVACLRLNDCLFQHEPSAELTELLVAPHARRRGVGRALVQRIELEAAAAGAGELFLMTAVRNEHAQAFYAALGYHGWTRYLRKPLPER
jgi:N-acetylglutamate synthase-like GNAT family acetyltransferase